MKPKTMTILLLMVLLAVCGCQEAVAPSGTVLITTDQLETETVERIRVMKIVQEELALTRSILMLQADVAKLKAPRTPPADKPKNE